jgi:pectinesterase
MNSWLVHNLNGVPVSKMVAVDPYVTGDFTTISEAVAAAPDNSVANDGYAVNVSMTSMFLEV